MHSLRQLFRERRLSVRTMDPRLRLATGGAAASLLGTVLLIALRDIGGANVALGRASGVVTAMSTPLFIATLVLLSIGFAYLLTGAALASPPIAIVALVLVTGEIGVHTGAFGSVLGFDPFSLLPDWARWMSRALLAVIWAISITVMVIDHRRGRIADRRMRLTVLASFAVTFGAYFIILKVASPDVGHLDLFPEAISLLMLDIADLVTPLLFIAAIDFGEWGGLLGERIAAGLKVNRSKFLVPVSAAISLTLVYFGLAKQVDSGPWVTWHRTWPIIRTTLIIGVTLAVMIAVGRAMGLHRRRWPATLNVAGVFAVVAVSIYLIAPLAGVLAGKFNGVSAPVVSVTAEGTYTSAADVTVERGGKGDLTFSVLIPRGWLRHDIANGTVSWSNYALPGPRPGELLTGLHGFEKAIVFPLTSEITPQQVSSIVKAPIKGAIEHEGEYTVFETDSPGLTAAQFWLRPNTKGGMYVLEFMLQSDVAKPEWVQPWWRAIAETFRIAGQPPATLEAEPAPPETEVQRSNDRFQAAVFWLTVPLALVLLALCFVWGRRWPARLVGAMLLFGVLTVATLLYFADEFGRGVLGSGVHLPYVGSASLYAGVGILALLALLVPLREPGRKRTLVVGLIALQTTVWSLIGMGVLYDHALNASRIAVWAAIIVLVAIAWDVLMSGESMTNEGSRRIPRAARVLAFLGYVILVAATVLFYSGQKVTGTGQAAESMFEPEAITRDGLFRVAFPLAVLMFLLRFGRNRGPSTPSGGVGPGGGQGLGEQPEGERGVGDHRGDPGVLGARW